MIAELSLKNFKTKQTIYRIVGESLTEYHQRSPMELLVRSLFLGFGYRIKRTQGEIPSSSIDFSSLLTSSNRLLSSSARNNPTKAQRHTKTGFLQELLLLIVEISLSDHLLIGFLDAPEGDDEHNQCTTSGEPTIHGQRNRQEHTMAYGY